MTVHVQVHVAKPERTESDVIGADVGAVNMIEHMLTTSVQP